MKPCRRGSWSLIGLLAALAVIGVMVFFMFGKSTGPATVKSDSGLLDQSSGKQTIYGKSMDTAKGTDCAERLRQIRSGVQMYRQSTADESNPPALKDAGMGVGPDYFNCPVSGKPYTYDPATGAVTCSYPEHAGY